MFGHLIPCGGGNSLALNQQRLVLKSRHRGGLSPTLDAELRLLDGWWHVRQIDAGCELHVNGSPCNEASLKPRDVITIRGKFCRIEFEAPEPAVPSRPSPPAEAQPVQSALAPSPPVQSTPAPSPAVPRPRGEREHRLGLLVPKGGGPPIELRKPVILIGRSSSCDVVLPVAFISSRHCSLELNDGYWRMVDLDSKNGTTVDGVSYRVKWVLPGSVLGLMSKRFVLEYQSQGPSPNLADDDVPVISKQSLQKLSGCSDRQLESILRKQPQDEATPSRWTLDPQNL